MEQPYYPPGAPMGAYPGDAPAMQFYNPPSYPPYPILLGPVQLPESVAYWHNTPIQQPGMAPPMGAPVSLQKQSAHGATDQKKHKRTRSGCFTCRARRVKVTYISPQIQQVTLPNRSHCSAMKLNPSVTVSSSLFFFFFFLSLPNV